MRLSREKLKEAILHPEAEIRERAVSHFAKSYSHDVSIVPLIIQAIERHGREGAYHLVGASTDLTHTDETISWVVGELDNDRSGDYENYAYDLTRVLCHADPALLVRRDAQILDARHFFRGLQETFLRRLELLSWDEAACWRDLERICEEGKDKEYANEVDIGYASQLVEALSRMGGQSEPRVLFALSQKTVNYDNNPMKWMEPLMLELAGLLRLEAAVPLILAKLHEDDDFLAGYCEEALTRIGTDSVVAAVAGSFVSAERHFRLYATGVLEHVHSDLSAEKSLGFLAVEEDQVIKRDLAHAVLSHFAYGGIEPVRQMLLSRRLDMELRHLRDYLVTTCAIMGERFPEYDDWRAAGVRERQEHQRKLAELADDPQATLLWAFERLKEYRVVDEPEEPPTRPLTPGSAAVRRSDDDPAAGAVEEFPAAADPKGAGNQVGRNDPCPCGSGKKFKKCCMKKQGGGLFD
jgi:hypothetical protein